MKKLFTWLFLGLPVFFFGQELPIPCSQDETMKSYYNSHPEALKEALEFEKITQKYVQKRRANKTENKEATYVIPVVVHVFGNDFNGKKVDDDLVRLALSQVNEEFNGLHSDWNDVSSAFSGRRGVLNIEFRLAQIDPWGNPTTGITYNPDETGFGADDLYDDVIRKYAWDNYKYMNLYILYDLYGQGATNNSGVAWYPSTYMSDNNVARAVFNGRYLATNAIGETTNGDNFRRILTHEYGHWLNLRHTFDQGCSSPGDYVDDTPATTSNAGSCNYTEETCSGAGAPNGENFMDYSDCYLMFTGGQVDRMHAALQHPSRKPLWQPSNHELVFIDEARPRLLFNNAVIYENWQNDGTIDQSRSMKVSLAGGVNFSQSSGDFTRGVHFDLVNLPSGLEARFTVTSKTTGEFTFTGVAQSHDAIVDNLEIKFTDAAFTGHSASEILGSNRTRLSIQFFAPYESRHQNFEGELIQAAIDGTNISPFSYGKNKGDNKYRLHTHYEEVLLDLFGKNAVAATASNTVQLLSEGTEIGPALNWKAKPDNNNDIFLITSPNHKDWHGKTGFLGVKLISNDGVTPPKYGWARIRVSDNGKLVHLIDIGYNEEPNKPISAGGLNEKSGMSISHNFIYEDKSNNGKITEPIFIYLSGKDSFKSNSGNLSASDYTMTGVPEGLSVSISLVNSKKAQLKFSGSATSHLEGDSRKFKISFKGSAFSSGNVSNISNTVLTGQLHFVNPYKIVHRKYLDFPSVGLRGTEAYEWIVYDNNIGDYHNMTATRFGWYKGEETTMLYGHGKAFIQSFDEAKGYWVPEMLTPGTVIGPSSAFENTRWGKNSAPVLGAIGSPWNGKTGYVGMRFVDPAGRPHYGWIKVSVTDGYMFQLEEIAYNSEPGASITVGETGPVVPCYATSSQMLHLNSAAIEGVKFGTFSTSSDIVANYTDNTNKEIKVRSGVTYPFELKKKCKYGTDRCTQTKFVIWIDFNNDADFDDEGEQFYVSPANNQIIQTENITVPADVSGKFLMRVFLGISYEYIKPCRYPLHGEFEDYTINISPSNPLPPIPDFDVSEVSVLEKNTVTFTDKSLYEPTSWSWSFPGGTPSTSTLKNPEVVYNSKGVYNVTLTATNADGSTTIVRENYITVTESPNSYCIPQHSNSGVRYIKNVRFANLDHTSGKGLSNGYSDYTYKTVNVKPGSTYTLAVKASGISATSYSRNNVSAWIDYNQNNSFPPSERIMNINATPAMVADNVYPTVQVTIPAGIAPGSYRMRLRHTNIYNDSDDSNDINFPCKGTTEGESEDYTIVIRDESGGDTQAPTAPSNLTTIAKTTTSVSLSWTASTDDTGVTAYDVYNGGNIVTTVTSTSATVSGLTANTAYTFTIKAKDVAGNVSGSSDPLNVTTMEDIGSSGNYCTLESMSSLYSRITRVNMGSINNASGQSTYTDYTSIWTAASQGSSQNISISLNQGAATSDNLVLRIWVDWNKDDDFIDDNEIVVNKNLAGSLFTNKNYTWSGNIVVPAEAVVGNARMRVMIAYKKITENPGPCGIYESGEVEDYTLDIRGSGLGKSEVKSKVTVSPNPNKGVFTVTINSNVIGEKVLVNIINTSGQVIKQHKALKKKATLEIPMNISVTSGVYTLQVITSEGIVTEKIINY
jgi:PKD repeat protein